MTAEAALVAPPMKPMILRGKHGKPKIIPLGEDGLPDLSAELELYERPSSYAGCLEDTYHLNRWGNRQVLKGAHLDPSIMLAVAGALVDEESDSSKSTLNELADRAKVVAKSGARSGVGTSLHSFCEAVDRGRDISTLKPPREFLPVLTNYARHMDSLRSAWGFEIVDFEVFVICDDLKAAGSLDRVWYFPNPVEIVVPSRLKKGDAWIIQIPGNVAVIDDTKTGDNLDFGQIKFAGQLAIYANSDRYDPTAGVRSPLGLLPDGRVVPVYQDVGFITHLDSAGRTPAATHPVDLVEGLAACYQALKVRELRSACKDWVGQAVPITAASKVATAAPAPAPPAPPAPPQMSAETNNALAQAITQATSLADLEQIWVASWQEIQAKPGLMAHFKARAKEVTQPPAAPEPPAPPSPPLTPTPDRPGPVTDHPRVDPPARGTTAWCMCGNKHRLGWTRVPNTDKWVCADCGLESKANNARHANDVDALADLIAHMNTDQLRAVWGRVSAVPELVEILNARWALLTTGMVSNQQEGKA